MTARILTAEETQALRDAAQTGPLVVQRCCAQQTHDGRWSVRRADGTLVAEVKGLSGDRAEAVARLLAAAPDLAATVVSVAAERDRWATQARCDARDDGSAIDKLAAERDDAFARLAAARKLIAPWRHGEDCPAGVHDECVPDAEDGDADCLEGGTLDACRAAKGVCECGTAALRALLGDVPAGDARTLGEARATAEKLRADVAFWRRSSEAAHARSVEAAELRGEIARLTRDLTTQTARGDGAEASELRMARERDAALARAEEITRALRSAERSHDATLGELAAQRAIIEGRTVAPTDEEIAAHAANYGSWRFRVNGSVVQTDDPHRLRVAIAAHARHGTHVRWWAHDRNDAPCAWPVAGGGQ